MALQKLFKMNGEFSVLLIFVLCTTSHVRIDPSNAITNFIPREPVKFPSEPHSLPIYIIQDCESNPEFIHTLYPVEY